MAAGVAVVLLAVACTSAARGNAAAAARTPTAGVLAAGESSGTWASPTELLWLGKLGAWNTRLMEGLQRAGRIESSPPLARRLLGRDGRTVLAHESALEAVDRCAADLRGRVGAPPTERLTPAFRTFVRACTHLERFDTAIKLAIFREDESMLREAQLDAQNGGRLLLEADRGLPPGEVRSLPVIGGAAAASRVEPRFSRVASRLAGKEVEVRCWSHADWQRLLREEKAYTKHRIDEDTLGFAGISGARASLSPAVCDSLVDLVYGHARPSSAEAQFPLATALVTLAHEPQHAKGIAGEAEAECYAIQLMVSTGVQLGIGRSYAAQLAKLYWAHYGQELPGYRSAQCAEGGALDLRKASPSFP